jgi:hypothetical protein
MTMLYLMPVPTSTSYVLHRLTFSYGCHHGSCIGARDAISCVRAQRGRHGRAAADPRHPLNDPASGPCRSSACAWWLEWAAGFLRRRVGVAESTPRSTQRCRATLLTQAWFARSTQLPREGCRRWCLPQNAAYAPKTGALPRALAPLRCPQQVR